jgi:hypothetical protein
MVRSGALVGKQGLWLGGRYLADRRELVDPTGHFPESVGIGADGALLVRPDGFVSWRACESARDPVEGIAGALSRALGSTGPS